MTRHLERGWVETIRVCQRSIAAMDGKWTVELKRRNRNGESDGLRTFGIMISKLSRGYEK